MLKRRNADMQTYLNAEKPKCRFAKMEKCRRAEMQSIRNDGSARRRVPNSRDVDMSSASDIERSRARVRKFRSYREDETAKADMLRSRIAERQR